jgi:hypothetical protein
MESRPPSGAIRTKTQEISNRRNHPSLFEDQIMSQLKLHETSRPEFHPISRLVSTRPPSVQDSGFILSATTLLLRLACSGLLIWIGVIHLHLWLEGYRHLPTNGPLFLADAVVAFVFAAALLAWPRAIVGLLGAAFTLGTLGALVISINIGLFGFQESTGASFVVLSLVIEAIATVVLLVWSTLIVEGHRS